MKSLVYLIPILLLITPLVLGANTTIDISSGVDSAETISDDYSFPSTTNTETTIEEYNNILGAVDSVDVIYEEESITGESDLIEIAYRDASISSSSNLIEVVYTESSISSSTDINVAQSNDTEYYALVTIYEEFDFSVDVRETSVSIIQGGGDTITVDVLTGCTSNVSNVTLTAYNLPSGVTITFDPNGWKPNYTSTGIISVGAVAPTGTYTINVTGESDGLVRWDTFTLNILEYVFDFSLDILEEKVRVAIGSSGTFHIHVEKTGSADSTVNLTVSGVPPNSTYTLSPDKGTPTFDSILLIQTTENTPIGNYTIEVCGQGDSITRCDTATLEVVKVKLPAILDFLFDPLFVLVMILGSIGAYVGASSPWVGASLTLVPLIYTALKNPDLTAFLVVLLTLSIVYIIKKVFL